MTKAWVAIASAILCTAQVHIQNTSADPLTATPSVYGTTFAGGTYGAGVVYKVDQNGNETILYSFSGADGVSPASSLTTDSEGNLYGTTLFGGKNAAGTVFKLDSAGHETVLHNFGGSSGTFPLSGVVRDSAGNLYGTAPGGGRYNRGVVYKLNANGNGTVLHAFTGGADGGVPQAGVIRDSAGNLYGTALFGGLYNFGVVFKLDSSGNETVLYSFKDSTDGACYCSPVVQDSAGNLYGTTYYGGAAGKGVVYRLDPSGNQTVIYNFTGGSDGGSPVAGLTRDSAGSLYGTTYFGGNGFGVVYKIDANGNETVLHTFNRIDGFGTSPESGVVLDSAGNLYGTTLKGVNKIGVVYKIGKGGQGTVLYTFSGPDGSLPNGVIVR